MSIWEAVVLGILEGFTEFLPISSTGHLTIAEKIFGFSLSSADITAFTAIIQVGAVLATVLYFRSDIVRVFRAWLAGILGGREERKQTDYRFGWAIIWGSLPIAVVGLVFRDQIETTLRTLWVVSAALILWSGVMWIADKTAKQNRHEKDVTRKDTLIIGVVQCLALIPGVSRSGATMAAGLAKGFDRVTVTRLSFFLSIPALLAAGLLQTVSHFDEISTGVGWPVTIIATVTSFVVAYLTVDWLLKFISKHSYTIFIVYRVAIGLLLLVLLSSGTIAPK